MFAFARFVRLVSLFALFAVALAARAADMVYFNDGRILIGEIIKETDDEVEAKGTIDGVAMHSTFKRSQIASLIKDTKRKPSTIVKPTPDDAESKGDFLIVPLRGEFGTDIYPIGLSNAMDWAIKNKVPRIVMVIDSPGGKVWAAEHMTKLIKDRDSKLKFTMVIDRAISASIWPTFVSDEIYATPEATFGGAVVFVVNNTGAAEVDQKMNSILAAELAATAERKGHSGALVRAMMLPGSKLWAIAKPGNRWEISDTAPAAASRAESHELFAGGVATLTGMECVKYGVARFIGGSDADSIARALGGTSAGSQGEAAMANAKTACDALIKRYDQWRRNINDRIEKLNEAAATTKDKESLIRRIDDLANTITNSIGPIKEAAKNLQLLPLVNQMEAEDVAEFRKLVEKAKAKIRGK